MNDRISPGTADAVKEIESLVAEMDAMSSLLAEIKAGTKVGNTFVLLLNLFLMENTRSGDSKAVHDLSVHNLADAVNLDSEELAEILEYLTNRGFIQCQEI
ncbi:MAG: hypothetical protein KGZ94_11345 [Clostridia bacterium]|nr:hypothetical protein [Clostridia bacterium]